MSLALSSRRPFTVVDLFAGAGGWSTGAVQAGAAVLMAVNHWARAIATHSANHPGTQHVCQDLSLMDHSTLPDHDLLLASPSCVGHSPARGKERKYHDAMRDTAWRVVDVLEAKQPAQFVVENVPKFRDWGLYDVWLMALGVLGYSTEEHVLDASEWGTPQERKRLIITGRRRGRAVRLQSPGDLGRPAKDLIRWDAGTWGSTKERASRTMHVIEHGRATYGERFLVPYYSSGSGLKSRSLDRPVGTLTTKDRYAVVDGGRMRMLSVDECRSAMGFPADYVLHGTREEQMMQLGNAVPPPLARHVVQQMMAAA